MFYKQRGANFLRTGAYVLACSVSQLPLAIGETLLFGSLVRFTADVLSGNRAMLGVFARTGLPTRREREDGVIHLEMELGPEPS